MSHPSHHLSTCFHLPDTVTAHEYELYTFIFYFCYLGIRCYDLILWWQIFTHFVLQIAQGSRQIQIAIYTAFLYCPSSFFYTLLLMFIIGFVIPTQFFCLTLDSTHHRSGIACICNINKLGCDKTDISSAASIGFLFIFGPVLLFPHFFLYFYDFFFSLRRCQHLVHSHKSLFKSKLVVLFMKVLVYLQLMYEVFADKSRNLCT